MKFKDEEQAKEYAERNYYPDTYKIKETVHGNFIIKKFYCCLCNSNSDLNHIRDEIFICDKCVAENSK